MSKTAKVTKLTKAEFEKRFSVGIGELIYLTKKYEGKNLTLNEMILEERKLIPGGWKE